jgi:hypothetical protein
VEVVGVLGNELEVNGSGLNVRNGKALGFRV